MFTVSASGATDIGGAKYKENQDSYFIQDGYYGVLDGHGKRGKLIAETASEYFQKGCCFEEVDRLLSPLIPHTAGAGGTTASLLRIDPVTGGATVSNVGDSEIRYYDIATELDTIEEDYMGIAVSVDHGTPSIQEFNRMLTETGTPPLIMFDRGDTSSPPRAVFIQNSETGVWYRNPQPGYRTCSVSGDWSFYLHGENGDRLAMTRAIGDYNMKKEGVIATPSITQVPPPSPGVTRTFVLASDGLWDVLAPEVVGAIIHNFKDGEPQESVKALIATAKERGEAYFGTDGDNICVVVVRVTPVKK